MTLSVLAALTLLTPRPSHATTILDGNGVVAQALNDGALIDPNTTESPSSFSGNDLTNHGPNDANVLLTNSDSIQLFQVPYFTISGVDYFGFILDVAETSPNRTVDVTQIILGAATQSDLSDAVQIWSLAANILINSESPNNLTNTPLGAGGDAILLVPVNLFTGRSSNDYLKFQSAMDQIDNGDDEWALANVAGPTFNPGVPQYFPVGTQIPEPGTLGLFAAGLGGLGFVGRRRHE